jgi:putative pyruvate formate lyase activating enzyme
LSRAALNILEEPVALSVFEDEERGRVGFSDLPEQLIPSLVSTFGEQAVAGAIVPSETEVEFYRALDVSSRTRPRYLDLYDSGELERRVTALERQGVIEKRVPYFMAAVNRSDEAVLGRTGAIYFVCKKGCHFCQYRTFPEHQIGPEGIAERMLALQAAGADNIQWVSPSSYTRVLLKAVLLAARGGLKLPIVHNGEGEDGLPELGLLNGVVDVYLPDAKFIRPESANRIGLPASYTKRMQACLTEMYRQVGPLKRLASAEAPRAAEGVLVRHLIMPDGVEEAKAVFEFLESLDPNLPVHVMTTYQPLHAAAHQPGINRHVTPEEVAAVAEAAHELELQRVYVR